MIRIGDGFVERLTSLIRYLVLQFILLWSHDVLSLSSYLELLKSSVKALNYFMQQTHTLLLIRSIC